MQIVITEHTRESLKDDRGYGFTDFDIKPLSDTARFKRAFPRSPHNFRFVLDSRRVYKRTEEEFKPTVSPRMITVLLTQNVSQDQIALTPWILAHRIGHCIQAAMGGQTAEGRVFNVFDEIIRASSPEFVKSEAFVGFAGQNGMTLSARGWDVMANYLDTRCARNHRIVNALDLFAECVASYLIRGTVRLRQPEQVKVYREFAYDFKRADSPTLECAAQPYDTSKMEQKINAILDETFTSLRGKVIRF